LLVGQLLGFVCELFFAQGHSSLVIDQLLVVGLEHCIDLIELGAALQGTRTHGLPGLPHLLLGVSLHLLQQPQDAISRVLALGELDLNGLDDSLAKLVISHLVEQLEVVSKSAHDEDT
jgi:hypothetical protein